MEGVLGLGLKTGTPLTTQKSQRELMCLGTSRVSNALRWESGDEGVGGGVEGGTHA